MFHLSLNQITCMHARLLTCLPWPALACPGASHEVPVTAEQRRRRARQTDKRHAAQALPRNACRQRHVLLAIARKTQKRARLPKHLADDDASKGWKRQGGMGGAKESHGRQASDGRRRRRRSVRSRSRSFTHTCPCPRLACCPVVLFFITGNRRGQHDKTRHDTTRPGQKKKAGIRPLCRRWRFVEPFFLLHGGLEAIKHGLS